MWTYQLGYAIEEAQHRKASQPADSPAKPATPKSPPAAPAKAISAPPEPPDSAQGPSDLVMAITAGLAVAVVTLVVIIMLVAANFNSRSVSSSSSSTSPSTSSGGEVTTSDTPSESTTASSLTWGTPPDVLQGADEDGDDSCNGGFSLRQNVRVAPAIPSEPGSFTSCGFAKAVGQAYLDSHPDCVLLRRISAPSPTAKCSDVQNTHPGVECDNDNFWMQCQKEGPDEAMWIACRGGSRAVVYIY